MGRAQQGRKRRRRAGRENRAALTAFCVALTAIMLALIVYVAQWYLNRARIRAQGERYAQIYNGGESESPAPTAPATPLPAPTATPTPEPEATATPTVAPTATATAKATARPTKRPTATPAPTRAPDATKPAAAVRPTDAPLPAPSPSPAPAPGSDMPVAVDVPIPTPDVETLVIALPTAPPVQAAFTGLLDVNPETVGFLDIEGMLALPVVQRENDNTYYLNHSFEGAEVQEGALFLDGMNRLVPEDDCLIVYGHNMKNKTMFGRLSAYGDIDHLRRHPVIRFDTLYENRSYVVFAAFTASMKPGDRRYFDVRQFVFDEGGFDRFVLKLKSRSVYNVPVEVRGGDRLLLLVTCDYTNREGRFILALRQLRPEETEGGVWAQVMQASEK